MKKHTYDDNGNMSSKVFVKGENTTETQFSYDGFDRTTGIKIGDVMYFWKNGKIYMLL